MELQIQMVQSGAWVAIGSAITVGLVMLPALGTSLGQGYAIGKAVEAIGRQPEARSGITSTLLVGCAVSETIAIYGLLLGFILFFVNPFFNSYVTFVTGL